MVRVERAHPPSAPDVLAAVGAGVALLCVRGDTLPAGDERSALYEAWRGSGRIVKVVRRARRAEWRRACSLDGVKVTAPAEVVVGWPHPEGQVPDELRHCQIAGTDLTWPDVVPAAPEDEPVLLAVLTAGMTTGKAAAQVGHAAQLALGAAAPSWRAAWIDGGCRCVVVRAADLTSPAGAPLVEVRDSGRTELEPGTLTVRAWALSP